MQIADTITIMKYFLSDWQCYWLLIDCFIIHQTHYEKSDWSRAFNQFTIAWASADNTDLGFDNSSYHAQLHPIIV